MGVVYLAEDQHLARRVAIKFLTSTDHHYRARFIREARAVSALSHQTSPSFTTTARPRPVSRLS